MFKFTVSINPELILEAFRSENNRRWVWPDGVEPEGFTLPTNFCFVEVWNTGIYYGCFCLEPKGEGVAEVHTTLLPICYGRAALIGKEFIRWIPAHLPLRKLLTLCSEDNELIKKLTLRCGFRQTGKSNVTWMIADRTHLFDIFELELGGE